VSDTIGFGYCRHDGNETYVTGGLREKYRGKGYGRKLFLHLLKAAKDFNTRITLEVLNTNERAKGLYESIGFHTFEVTARLTKMEYRND
jgi:ribosomal protein S18 acetylase RimI-like enzyme